MGGVSNVSMVTKILNWIIAIVSDRWIAYVEMFDDKYVHNKYFYLSIV